MINKNNNNSAPGQSSDLVDIYVDGSFDDIKELASWAYIVVKESTVMYQDKGYLYGKINEGRQVGGELRAVIEAIEYCKTNKVICNIFFDYMGIYKWIADLFGGKPWRAKKFYTKDYRKYVIKNKDYIKNFVKVKGHSSNKYNKMVDELANLNNSLTEITRPKQSGFDNSGIFHGSKFS